MASLQTLKNTFLPGISASQDFFELLRRIERATPEQGRLGTQRDRSHLRLRIIQPADMGFAPREVSDIRQTLNTHQHLAEITIFCRHFGLFAPYGPLPIHVTEHARNEALAKRNQAFEHFAGILSQRMAILHYRSWAQMHVAVGHDRASANPFMNHVRQIVGLTPQQALNSHVDRVRRCFPGGYLPGRGSLRKLQEILSLYFSVPIRVEARKGLWIDDSRNIESQRMGRLGNTRIGSRFFDVQHSLVLSIGPVSDPQYLDFQRNSKRINTLVQICHDFVRHRMVLDVQLIIQTSPNMACRLGGGTLSRHSWLKPGSALSIQPIYRTVT
ncbi:type VI secretion system baseplate subunit TssG [Yersinia pseudotuberculosis]|uniref:type VI secretion system baseplate subunit TssG n=1 Tax=Yersinia pseudotuberculosis TaxID=633 RepID=UPI0040382D16